VLSGVHSLKAMLNGHHSPGLDDLRARSAKTWELTHAGRYAELTDLLRALIPDLETAARALPAEQHAEVFELMAGAYQACSAALAKLGEAEAAWIAADRAMGAAERAGNALLVAAGAFRLVFVFLGARHYAQAEETARTAADALWHVADEGNTEAMSLWGALTLQRAITAARTGDATAAYSHLERAGEMAERLGPGRNDFNTEFGPANVALIEISVAVDLGDAGRALRAASAIDFSALSAERQARTLIDVARAHAQRRQVADAIAALRRAEDITPEQVRGHYVARQIVSDLLTMQDPPGDDLRALSVRLGAAKIRD
jgi:tetratricopeptide (TPR) repeat protein